MTGSSQRALIFGGSGFIGTHLARNLSNRDWEVAVADLLPPQDTRHEFFPIDVRNEISIHGSWDRVYNLAAVHRTPGHRDCEYFETNVMGALNIAAWAARADISDMVFTSSISVYGSAEASRDEESPSQPNSSYGYSKLMAERILEQWQIGEVGRRLLVVRPAVIYGRGEHGNFTRLANALAKHRFAFPGRDDTIKACGYVGDLLDSMEFMLARGEAMDTYNFCYPVPVSIREVCMAFNRVGGYAMPRTIPAAAMRAVTMALNALPTSPTSNFAPQRVAKLTASTNIAPGRLIELGYQWPTNLELGLRLWTQDSKNGAFL